MPTLSNPISNHIRAHKREIGATWETITRKELPTLRTLDRAALIDHLPEFLEALAKWIEGDTKSARQGFEALAEGHALQRLLNGVGLSTLTKEYALLRTAITRELLSVATSEEIREPLVRLNEGLDEAIYEAVQRYSHRRDQTRDRFIGILAHDLRSPLATVAMASANIMAATPPGNRLYRMGAAIALAVERMVGMIDDVIELARGQLGGTMPMTLKLDDLGDIVAEAVTEQRIAHPSHTITIETHGDLSGHWDRARVIQLLTNLISNAINYGEGPIRITLRESSDRQAIDMSVNNKGPLIPAARLKNLFDPLRLETPGTRTGLGLGLYIVRQIALAHGATCEVSSDESEGTTFRVRWPRTPVEDVPSRT